jgi:alkylmercury lyase
MSTDYVEQTTALIGRVEGTELLPHAIRLLSEGEPVALERLAAAAGWSVEDVEAALTVQTSAERDDQGRLVGLALTLRPTTHRVTVDGRTLFAWCATDTLMVPVVLGRPALVESTCPQTGQAIRVELTPDDVERVDPPDAVMTAVRPPGQLADVRSDTCAHGHFFSAIAATAAWTDAHPDGHIYPVEEAFRLDREVIKQLGWAGR